VVVAIDEFPALRYWCPHDSRRQPVGSGRVPTVHPLAKSMGILSHPPARRICDRANGQGDHHRPPELVIERHVVARDRATAKQRRRHATRVTTPSSISLVHEAAVGSNEIIAEEGLVDLTPGPLVAGIARCGHPSAKPRRAPRE